MPDFTVIEGGGPGDWPAERARAAFGRLVIEMLRALARGDDPGMKVLEAFNKFAKHASEASTPPAVIIDEEMSALYDRALRREHNDAPSDERRSILEDALRVVAESLADDPAAKGRKSKREDALLRSIESFILAREKRSRANGWSYTQNLTTNHLGKWSPPPRPKATPVRKPREPRAPKA